MTDLVIVGAGLTGAVVAHEVASARFDVLVLVSRSTWAGLSCDRWSLPPFSGRPPRR